MKPLRSITISEWETASPQTHDQLTGYFIEPSLDTAKVVDALNQSGMLQLVELKGGTQITAGSHVGRVRIADLSVTILPKLKGGTLFRLLRYAYGFRRLELVSQSQHLLDEGGFEDLLVTQLNAEVRELIARGLSKAYERQDERLSSPKGRIDLNRFARDGGVATATLPCRYFPRVEDAFLNQILLAGLRVAAELAGFLELRRDSHRLAALLEDQVSRITLDARTLEMASRRLNRLTAAYTPALSIIRLLIEAQGIVLEGRSLSTTLPGFLFDMNRFFQALVSRFLKDNLPDCVVREEVGLKGMMRYNPAFNPRHKQSHTPRPDYAILQNGQLVSLLDAKYRDLWENNLPREMLYQLVMYAICHRHQLQSSILYPTSNPLAREARIDVSDPVYGQHLGQVCLRPIMLPRLEQWVLNNTAAAARERQQLAKELVWGSDAKQTAGNGAT